MTMQHPRVDSDIISTSFTMLFAGGESEQAVTATLRYNVFEPFQVIANLSMDDAPAVQWVLARELLREGLVLPSGIGDITVRPTPHGVLIGLRSPGGQALLLAPTEPIAAFVQAVYRAVPDGAEGDFFSIEAELDLLADI